jgi:hypothetical protein|nr:MAG TPA: hypothetical protein [Caudoviricetes sp.]
MEEDKKQIIIPLSEYRKMEQKILDLTQKNKEKKEDILKEYESAWESRYTKTVGQNFHVNVRSIVIKHNSLTDYIFKIVEEMKAKEEEILCLKTNEGVFKDIYLQLKNQKRDLHWWQLYQRMKINRMLELIEKRVKWTQNNS